MATVWVHDRRQDDLDDDRFAEGDYVVAPEGTSWCIGAVGGGPERPAAGPVDWFATVDVDALPEKARDAVAEGSGLRRPEQQEALLRAVQGIADAHHIRGG